VCEMKCKSQLIQSNSMSGCHATLRCFVLCLQYIQYFISHIMLTVNKTVGLYLYIYTLLEPD